MRVVTANNSFRNAFTEQMLFEQLLSGLPEEYSTTRAAIDAQSNLTVQEKLYILTVQESRLSAGNIQALAARSSLQKRSKSKRRPKYDSGSGSESENNSDSESFRKLKCWACKARGHFVQDCPILLQLQTIVQKLSSASLQTEKSNEQSSESAKQKDKSAKGKTKSVKPSRRRPKEYTTDSNSSDPDLSEDEVATFAQDFGLQSRIEESCLSQSESVCTPTESEEEIEDTALLGGAPADSSQYSKLGRADRQLRTVPVRYPKPGGAPADSSRYPKPGRSASDRSGFTGLGSRGTISPVGRAKSLAHQEPLDKRRVRLKGYDCLRSAGPGGADVQLQTAKVRKRPLIFGG
jgi:hypothetical protein